MVCAERLIAWQTSTCPMSLCSAKRWRPSGPRSRFVPLPCLVFRLQLFPSAGPPLVKACLAPYRRLTTIGWAAARDARLLLWCVSGAEGRKGWRNPALLETASLLVGHRAATPPAPL